jgi:hypothetical protein
MRGFFLSVEPCAAGAALAASDDHVRLHHSLVMFVTNREANQSDCRYLDIERIDSSTVAAAMHPAKEFLMHAEECRRMAESSRSPEDKRAWIGMADRWLICARHADEELAAASAFEGKAGVGHQRRARRDDRTRAASPATFWD